MKKILLVCAAMTALSTGAFAQSKKFTDSRDGKTYKTVSINNQEWMAENLNFEKNGSHCYQNEYEYCNKYGRLYTWDSAKEACPEGWRLPTSEELEKLKNTAEKMGTGNAAAKILKSRTGWTNNDEGENGNGSDALRFAALPAGVYSSKFKVFANEGRTAAFWSSTEIEEQRAKGLEMNNNGSGKHAYIVGYEKHNELSVRCVTEPKPKSKGFFSFH